jgi:hypothetical protein
MISNHQNIKSGDLIERIVTKNGLYDHKEIILIISKLDQQFIIFNMKKQLIYKSYLYATYDTHIVQCH